MQTIISKVSASCSYGFKAKHVWCVVFICAVIMLHLFSQHNNLISPKALDEVLNNAGNLSPVLFIITYACGICLFFPAIMFTAVGAILFGVNFGFFYNMAGAMLGASLAFLIGRYFGHHFFVSLLTNRLGIYKNTFVKDGFAATFYLRLVCFPFTPLSFGMGMTEVTFKDYFWGTFLGKFASGFIITFFFASLKEVMISWQFEQLLQWEILLASMLFVGSLYISKLLRTSNCIYILSKFERCNLN